MNQDTEIERFVRDPSLLVKLCREVIDQLGAESNDAGAREREAQLGEISRAMKRLERAGIAVPDALRAEKTRLAATLSSEGQFPQDLQRLVVEFDGILKDLKARLGRSGKSLGVSQRGRRSRSPKTERKVLRECIVCILQKHGGGVRCSDVISEMGKELQGKLLPGDREWRESTNEYAWQNNAKWERHRMTKDGTLKKHSPHGIWELSEDKR